MRWMVVSEDNKLDLLLLVDGEELQKLVETLPEQPTTYTSHIEKFNQHFEVHRNNTLEMYKLLNREWPFPTYHLPILKQNAGNKGFTASFQSHWIVLPSC